MKGIILDRIVLYFATQPGYELPGKYNFTAPRYILHLYLGGYVLGNAWVTRPKLWLPVINLSFVSLFCITYVVMTSRYI